MPVSALYYCDLMYNQWKLIESWYEILIIFTYYKHFIEIKSDSHGFKLCLMMDITSVYD